MAPHTRRYRLDGTPISRSRSTHGFPLAEPIEEDRSSPPLGGRCENRFFAAARTLPNGGWMPGQLPPLYISTAVGQGGLALTEAPRHGHTSLEDESVGRTSYQVVLFQERNIVVYDPMTSRMFAKRLTPSEEIRLRSMWMRCPVCAQYVDLANFSLGGQAYFLLLEGLIRRGPPSRPLSPTQSSRRACTSTNPFTSYGRGSLTLLAFPCAEEAISAVSAASSNHCERNDSDNDYFPESTSDYPIPLNISHNNLVTGYYRRFFREMKKLGSGSYGQVFLCHHVLDDLVLGEYAVKKIPVGDDRSWLQRMIQEVKIRERLHHPNVVDYKHSWLEMHRSNNLCPYVPWLFVLMECCNAGDLDILLFPKNTQDLAVPLPETLVWKVLHDILLGLQHLHHNGILHRDLKLSNILLQCRYDQIIADVTCNALLTDFGTARLISESQGNGSGPSTGFTGTVEYTAPELLSIDEEGAVYAYNVKSDIWSLGIILYALTEGRLPFSSPDPVQCRQDILDAPDFLSTGQGFQQQCNTGYRRSPELTLLIKAMLSKDPKYRPSADDLLNHRDLQVFFQNVNLERAAVKLARHVMSMGCRRQSEDLTMSSSPRPQHPQHRIQRKTLGTLRPR